MIGRISCAAILSLLFVFSALAEGLDSRLEVYEVLDGEVATAQAEKTLPGQILEYHLIYTNTSKGEFKRLEINGLIPKNTQYVAESSNSATPHEFFASIDGGRVFGTEPLTREVTDKEGNVVKETVSPSEYTHIKWKTKESIKEGQTQVYKYRVIVE